MLFRVFVIFLVLLHSQPLFAQEIHTRGIDDQPSGTVTATERDGRAILIFHGTSGAKSAIRINTDSVNLEFTDDIAEIERPEETSTELIYLTDPWSGSSSLYYIDYAEGDVNRIPLWLSLLPPLLAILFALIFREVIISLFAGIWLGAFIAVGLQPELIIRSLLAVVDKYVVDALTDSGHISIIVFSVLIGSMVAVISRNGGMAGVVMKLSRYARTPRSSQFITWLLGVAIFFDDYANTLIVGTTMRPVTDKFRVSREKLAYIVDSTAAPVAAIAFITTWIGAELGYIADATATLGIAESAYSLFLNSLKFAYYPIFTLCFVLMIIMLKRDFGPMLKAEARAATGKVSGTEETADDETVRALQPAEGIKLNWLNAVIPVLVVISVTIAGLIITGWNSEVWQDPQLGFFTKLSEIIGAADSYIALLWASVSGVAVAVIMSLGSRTLSLTSAMNSVMDGIKMMMPAIIILTLAWSLASVTEELHTAQFLIQILSGTIAPQWMPLVTFILAAIIAFSTGSSWGTMAILYPLVLPSTWILAQEAGLPTPEAMNILYNVIAVVLAGAVFGDHCSPISDTTVLSSLASSCNHIEHVRTQLPYAITVGLVSLLTGGIFFALGIPWYICYPVGLALLYLVVRFWGRVIV